jgi:glycerol-3-phosphate acyltransferase PlsY
VGRVTAIAALSLAAGWTAATLALLCYPGGGPGAKLWPAFWPAAVLGAMAYSMLFLMLGTVFRHGTLIALAWPVGLAACATWAVTAAITRISSLSALVAAALSGMWCFVFSRGDLLILTFALMLLVYIRHWPNLQRIKAGTEPKIGQKS